MIEYDFRCRHAQQGTTPISLGGNANLVRQASVVRQYRYPLWPVSAPTTPLRAMKTATAVLLVRTARPPAKIKKWVCDGVSAGLTELAFSYIFFV